MKKTFIFITGIALGFIVALALVVSLMPSMMIRTQVSPSGLDETVELLNKRAVEQGWVVSGISRIDESVKKHGGGEVPRVRLINFCQPAYAARILNDPEARHVSVFMPCTISVYEGDDGKAYVSSMNAGLLGKMMGGTIAEVMGGHVDADQQEVLAFLDE